MATQKPISTISYNSESFLKEKLNEWLSAHIIQAFQYIPHKGEDGDKDHIHLRIEPNKKLDPMDLSAALREFAIGSDKPLGVRPWRFSLEEDWILYAVHDEDYMRLKYASDKGEKLPYKWKDIRVSDDYDMEIAFIRAKAKLEHTTANLTKRLMSGEDSLSLIAQGENPYVVNALMRAITGSAYTDLQIEFSRLNDEYQAVKHLLYGFGFDVQCELGEAHLFSLSTGKEIKTSSDFERSVSCDKNKNGTS